MALRFCLAPVTSKQTGAGDWSTQLVCNSTAIGHNAVAPRLVNHARQSGPRAAADPTPLKLEGLHTFRKIVLERGPAAALRTVVSVEIFARRSVRPSFFATHILDIAFPLGRNTLRSRRLLRPNSDLPDAGFDSHYREPQRPVNTGRRLPVIARKEDATCCLLDTLRSKNPVERGTSTTPRPGHRLKRMNAGRSLETL